MNNYTKANEENFEELKINLDEDDQAE